MLGKQHLRKVMLGGDVVWQKHRPKPPGTGGLTLETLEVIDGSKKVKLVATNHGGNLFMPMFFPPRKMDDRTWYLDKLTFIGEAQLSLQTIDAMLEADVVKLDMQFPMFFFDRQPPGRDGRQQTAADGRRNLISGGNALLSPTCPSNLR
jgi:hypothetical protein